jgi:Zn-dependent M28 family amino/carboxypeptidase
MEWRAQGYEVVRYPDRVRNVECANLEVTRRGTSRPDEIILIGAHYDSVEGCPGANDNGSGGAAMLEISRRFTGQPSERTLRFVAFVNEEPPYFETELMGSRGYAKACRQRGDDIRAMLSLETLGCSSDEPGSQHFPSPFFKLFYPSRGNFVAVVSELRSRTLSRQAVAAVRGNSQFPAECLATFPRLAGVGLSDQRRSGAKATGPSW